MPKRQRSFCSLEGDYEDFPDGSIAHLGIFACLPCLWSFKARDWREYLESIGIEIEKVEESVYV